MDSEKMDLHKLIKLVSSLSDITEQGQILIDHNFELCAYDYRTYCANMLPNVIRLDSYNIVEPVIYMYYSAVNTADYLIEEKEPMLKALESYDKNLFEMFNDKEKLKKVLRKFSNIMSFMSDCVEGEYQCIDNPDLNRITEQAFLYLFLDIGKKISNLRDFAKYSFSSDYFELGQTLSVELQFARTIANNYNTKKEVLSHTLNSYLNEIYFDELDEAPEYSVEIKETISVVKKIYDEKFKSKEVKPNAVYYDGLEQDLKENIIGQDKALTQISDRLKTLEFGVTKSTGAKAVYLLLGPTGVGKTETVKQLNSLIRKGIPLIRIDMSEYKEEHRASQILGAPPGYLGHDSSKDVLQQIKKNPNAIILLDEIEKAHPNILDLFLHMFDEGKTKNNQQEDVDLSNNIFFLTSNIGTREASKGTIGFNEVKEDNRKKYFSSLKRDLRPEFINRINEIVVFDNLSLDAVHEIINLQVTEIERLFKEQKNINLKLNLSDDIYNYIAHNIDYKTFGAREIRRAIERYILNNLVDFISENGYQDYKINFDLVDGKINLSQQPIQPLLKK